MKTKKNKNVIFLIIPIFCLLIISLLNMYSAKYISSLYEEVFLRQILWIIISIIVFICILKTDLNFLLKISPYTYLIGIISLVLVLIFGKEINGAKSWFKIGPFSFQPSEIFKFFYIIYLSKIVKEHKKGPIKLLFKILSLALIPCILIFLEPDTGVALMYLFLTLGITLASTIPKKYIVILSVLGISLIGTFLGLYFLERNLFVDIFGTSFFYRMDRLLIFKNSTSYQLNNALIGMGSSGLWGHGLLNSKIYIPEITTDFVFALTVCNFGFIGGIITIIIYSLILIFIHKEGKKRKDVFAKCIIYGIFFMMLIQTAEHILMNLGLAPITGITLPFLSYGGSSMISYASLFALIIKITTNNSSYN